MDQTTHCRIKKVIHILAVAGKIFCILLIILITFDVRQRLHLENEYKKNLPEEIVSISGSISSYHDIDDLYELTSENDNDYFRPVFCADNPTHRVKEYRLFSNYWIMGGNENILFSPDAGYLKILIKDKNMLPVVEVNNIAQISFSDGATGKVSFPQDNEENEYFWFNALEVDPNFSETQIKDFYNLLLSDKNRLKYEDVMLSGEDEWYIRFYFKSIDVLYCSIFNIFLVKDLDGNYLIKHQVSYHDSSKNYMKYIPEEFNQKIRQAFQDKGL